MFTEEENRTITRIVVKYGAVCWGDPWGGPPPPPAQGCDGEYISPVKPREEEE